MYLDILDLNHYEGMQNTCQSYQDFVALVLTKREFLSPFFIVLSKLI